LSWSGSEQRITKHSEISSPVATVSMNLKPTQGLFKFDFSDHHAFLGVSVDADATGVRDRYKEIARLMHPDSANWQTVDEKMLATKIFSSVVNQSYAQLSKVAQLQEQQVMLELLAKRVIADAGKIDISSSSAQKLYQQSTEDLNRVYHELLQELALQQYRQLGSSTEITGNISELNMVYLLRKRNQSVRSSTTGNTAAPGTESVTEMPKAAAEATKNPLMGEKAMRRAEEYINMRNWTKANVELREVLKDDPSNAIAHAQMAIVYYRQNQATMAKMHMNKAIQLDPSDPTVRNAKQEIKKLMSDAPVASKSPAAAGGKGGLFGLFGRK
jgi:tetratricopeptide (TPR) repeat protein